MPVWDKKSGEKDLIDSYSVASNNNTATTGWEVGESKLAGDPALAPYGAYVFALQIKDADEGLSEIGHFMECSGLKSACEVFEIQEGGMNHRVHKFPGQSKWENITLRTATTCSNELFRWRDQFLKDQFEERKKYSGFIKIMDNDFEVIRVYEFVNAWPVSWEGPSLNSNGSEIAIETLELAHDGLYLRTKAE
jgi:phage tail-like protein